MYNTTVILSIPVASAPTNLMVVQEDLTSIRVSWSPPTPLGYTTGYRIYYSDGNVSDIVDVSGGSTNNYLLTDLLTAATYTISIVGTFQHLPSERVETMITLCKSKRLDESIQFYHVLFSIVATGLTFSVRGDSIPNDGSVDIGDNNDNALLCRSGLPISSGGDWYLHPTQQSIDEDNKIVSPPADRGWSMNRDSDSEDHLIMRLRRASDTAEEGMFTCNMPGEFNTPVSVGIYYPSESYAYWLLAVNIIFVHTSSGTKISPFVA